MADVIKALGCETRRRMLRLILQKEMHVSGIARELGVSVPVALKHVRVLESCGLVSRERVGRSHLIRSDEEGLKRLEDIRWLIDSSCTVEVRKGSTLLDAVKSVSGVGVKKTKGGAFIDSVDGKRGYFIYEVDGRLLNAPVDKYVVKEDVVVELKRLVPVLGKKIRIVAV